MCFDCSRKTAATLASLLATGVPELSEYLGYEQGREEQAVRDAAELVLIARKRWSVDPDTRTEADLDALATEQTEALQKLYTAIGGKRFATAGHLLGYFGQIALEAAKLSTYGLEAVAQNHPGGPEKQAAAGINSSIASAIVRSVRGQLPPQLADMVQSLLTADQIQMMSPVTVGGKPAGTGPGGELH